MSETNATVPITAEREEAALRVIRDALRELRFGTVTAIIQDGVIVQVERTERHRIVRTKQKAE